MIRVSLESRQSAAEQLNMESNMHGPRSAQFLDLRGSLVNGLTALGKSESAALKCLERDRKQLKRGIRIDLRIVSAPVTLD